MFDAAIYADACRHDDELNRREDEASSFESWLEEQTAEQQVELYRDFLEATRRTAGVLIGNVDDRAPWLGKIATVHWNAEVAFEQWAMANRWPGLQS